MCFDDFELPPMPDYYAVANVYRWRPEHDAEFQRTTIPGLPHGYEFIAKHGVIKRLVGKRSERLCGPIKCVSHLKNSTGTESALQFDFIDREQNKKTLIVPSADLMRKPAEVAAKFVNHGLEIFGSVSHFSAFLKAWRPTQSRFMSKDVGWYEADNRRSFILRSGDVVSQDSEADAVGYVGPAMDNLASSDGDDGDIEAWKEFVAGPAATNPALLFAISAALTGPLLKLLNLNGGGFNLYARTSSGKTSTLFAAASVWGHPSNIPQWRGTEAGFEIAARMSNDNLLSIDEFKEGDLKSSTAIIYFVLNGTGAMRSDLNLSYKAPAQWLNIVLTSSEYAFTQHFENAKQKMPEGLTVRLADINIGGWKYGAFNDIAEFTSPGQFSDFLRENCRRYNGSAGPAFVKKLVAILNAGKPEMILERLKGIHEKATALLCKNIPPHIELSGPYLRVLDMFGCCAVAGILASHWRIVPWNPKQVIGAITEVAKTWAEERSKVLVDLPARLTEHLRLNLRENADLFADLDDGTMVDLKVHQGWFSSNRLDIKTSELRAICADVTPSETEAIKLLNAAGILIPGGESRSLQHRASQKIDKRRTRVYRLDLGVLFPDENPF